MKQVEEFETIQLIEQANSIVFLTGAGVSTPSGVPDYRSLSGVYTTFEQPEYLLSHTCLMNEPAKFYRFVRTLYHPEAKPNVIHYKIVEIEKNKSTWVISQNIDGLHKKAGSHQLVNFHGNLYECHCLKCGHTVEWEAYLNASTHAKCGGQVRPEITLYEESLSEQAIEQAIHAIESSDLVVIVGTSFQVHPFCDLINYASKKATILVINQTQIDLLQPHYFFKGNAMKIFQVIKTRE